MGGTGTGTPAGGSGSIVVGTNSWIVEADANTFMDGRHKASDYWTNGAVGNVPAIVTAYFWLTDSPRFSFPAVATAAMKRLQCEMALFLVQHQPDIDLRMGIQAQNVIEAGIVKEKYVMKIMGIPVPPAVANLAYPYLDQHSIYILDLERDEEELTSYDAVSNLDRS